MKLRTAAGRSGVLLGEGIDPSRYVAEGGSRSGASGPRRDRTVTQSSNAGLQRAAGACGSVGRPGPARRRSRTRSPRSTRSKRSEAFRMIPTAAPSSSRPGRPTISGFSGRLLQDAQDGDLDLAFSITERMRARSLLDTAGTLANAARSEEPRRSKARRELLEAHRRGAAALDGSGILATTDGGRCSTSCRASS